VESGRLALEVAEVRLELREAIADTDAGPDLPLEVQFGVNISRVGELLTVSVPEARDRTPQSSDRGLSACGG